MRTLLLLATITIAQLSFGQTTITTVTDNEGASSTTTCTTVGTNTTCKVNVCSAHDHYLRMCGDTGTSRADWKAYSPFMKTCKERGIKVSRYQKLDENNECYTLYRKSQQVEK